ncbi:hypothetical protein EZV76_15025 [Flagellimonas alvinocaridis]|uniref:RiboL-PSP-HEPN domain-containing protein n=1 Tax=Flagellimonas alvinocaridis TaxID=2530200 RepID=A0A4S8RKG4_9FLAO|nr:hypothetical protein [Allomuricauda alvinocaridis]THV57305.1 hypothetical protein EZV76_15025 [Allomuricauda alvinocaridis]
MNKTEFLKIAGQYRSQKQKLINDTFLWVSVSIIAMETIAESDDFLNIKKFEVPSRVKGKTVKRKPEDLKKIIGLAVNTDLYQSTFIYIVAQFEAFLSDIISLCLKYDQRKLRMNVSGGASNKKVDISEVLNCKTQDNIIDLIIDKQLGDLFYAGPKKQREYIEKVLSVELEEVQWLNWFEYKATRDLLVHNSGKINSIYLEKTGEKARGKLNEKIELNKEYFDDALSNIKSMIGRIDKGIRKSVKD